MGTLPYRRIVIRVQQGTPSLERLTVVVQLARACDLELLGLYTQDPNLGRIALHPQMREYRIQERTWRTMEQAQIASQIGSVVKAYERRFRRVLQSIDVRGQFAIEEAPRPAQQLESARSDDIIVVCEPRNPLDQLGQSFEKLVDAALASEQAVLIVPRRLVRTSGPVLAIAEDPNDPMIALASTLAAFLGQPARMLTVQCPRDMPGLPVRLAEIAPYLLLLSRRFLEGKEMRFALRLGRTSHVPVLITAGTRIEPINPDAD